MHPKADEIIRLSEEGRTADEIAKILGVSNYTVCVVRRQKGYVKPDWRNKIRSTSPHPKTKEILHLSMMGYSFARIRKELRVGDRAIIFARRSGDFVKPRGVGVQITEETRTKIFDSLSNGVSVRKISRDLRVSQDTVRKHRDMEWYNGVLKHNTERCEFDSERQENHQAV